MEIISSTYPKDRSYTAASWVWQIWENSALSGTNSWQSTNRHISHHTLLCRPGAGPMLTVPYGMEGSENRDDVVAADPMETDSDNAVPPKWN